MPDSFAFSMILSVLDRYALSRHEILFPEFGKEVEVGINPSGTLLNFWAQNNLPVDKQGRNTFKVC